MIFKTSTENELELLNLPETGMGFQVVTAHYKAAYTKHTFLILNSTFIIELDMYSDAESWKTDIEDSKELSLDLEEKQLFNIQIQKETKQFLLAEPSFRKSSKGALDNPVEMVTRELFYCIRLSAYYNDKRIDRKNMCLRPGSFTTSLEDYMGCLVNKYDFIERYAIPDQAPIRWAFQIAPKKGVDSYQTGVVQPNFGHKGGGQEYFFAKGTSFGTFMSETEVAK